MSIQCVSCCAVVRFKVQEPRCIGGLVHKEAASGLKWAAPPAGLDIELMVCSSDRNVGLLNLAV